MPRPLGKSPEVTVNRRPSRLKPDELPPILALAAPVILWADATCHSLLPPPHASFDRRGTRPDSPSTVFAGVHAVVHFCPASSPIQANCCPRPAGSCKSNRRSPENTPSHHTLLIMHCNESCCENRTPRRARPHSGSIAPGTTPLHSPTRCPRVPLGLLGTILVPSLPQITSA